MEKGGLEFRILSDMNWALIAKLCWNFETAIGSLWGNFMANKYGKKMDPAYVLSNGASKIWRK